MSSLSISSLIAVTASFSLASVAGAGIFNTHVGISVGSNGELVTENWVSGLGYQGQDHVFAFDGQRIGGMSFFDVGTNSVGGTFAYPGDIGFTFMGLLGLWNGSGFDDAGTTLTMQFMSQSATSGNGIVKGLGSAVRDPSMHPNNPEQWGRHHSHFDFFVDNNPYDGIYLMEFTLWYEAGKGNSIHYADSDSFWVLFNINFDAAEVGIAKEWVYSNIVPAPGALAILAVAGLARTGRRRCW